jgi:hypothetical protein
MKEKVLQLERQVHELREDRKEYVTVKHFDAVVGPMKNALDVLARDIKEILRAVSDRGHHSAP